MYILLNFNNPGREKELISSNVHLFNLLFCAVLAVALVPISTTTTEQLIIIRVIIINYSTSSLARANLGLQGDAYLFLGKIQLHRDIFINKRHFGGLTQNGIQL